MFSIKLIFYRMRKTWNQKAFNYFKRKVENKGYLIDMIYYDILQTFAYNENDRYRLYMKNAPIGEMDMERMWQELRNDFSPINEADLNFIYIFTIENITDKLLCCPSVKICPHNINGVKFFDVYWKNYKQKFKIK